MSVEVDNFDNFIAALTDENKLRVFEGLFAEKDEIKVTKVLNALKVHMLNEGYNYEEGDVKEKIIDYIYETSLSSNNPLIYGDGLAFVALTGEHGANLILNNKELIEDPFWNVRIIYYYTEISNMINNSEDEKSINARLLEILIAEEPTLNYFLIGQITQEHEDYELYQVGLDLLNYKSEEKTVDEVLALNILGKFILVLRSADLDISFFNLINQGIQSEPDTDSLHSALIAINFVFLLLNKANDEAFKKIVDYYFSSYYGIKEHHNDYNLFQVRTFAIAVLDEAYKRGEEEGNWDHTMSVLDHLSALDDENFTILNEVLTHHEEKIEKYRELCLALSKKIGNQDPKKQGKLSRLIGFAKNQFPTKGDSEYIYFEDPKKEEE